MRAAAGTPLRRVALFSALCAAGQSALFLARSGRLLAVTVPDAAPAARDVALYGAYTPAVCGLLALLLFGGNRVGARALVALGARRATAERWAAAGLVAAATLLTLLVAIEVKTYATLGVHLYSAFVLDNVLHPASAQRDLQFGAGVAISVALAAAALAAGFGALWWLLGWGERTGAAWWRRVARPALPVLLTVWVACAAWAALELTRPEVRQRPSVAALFLYQPNLFLRQVSRTLATGFTYAVPPPAQLPRLRRPASILAIMVETLRADALTPELMPQTLAFARRAGCLQAERNYAASHTTSYSVFSFLSGLHPSYAEYVADNQRALFPLEVLKRNGYAITGASSSKLAYYPQLAGLFREFSGYREFLDGPDRDRGLVDWFTASRAAGRERGRPSYTFLFFYTPHHNYYYPPQFERYTPVLPLDYDHFQGDAALGRSSAEIHNRYRNSVLYLDSLLAETLEAVRAEVDAGELAVVITGDHGEEFWEHGLLGHGQTRFENERVQTPLLVCLPGVTGRAVPLASHVDVWPTLLDFLDPDPPVAPDAWFSGSPLTDRAGREPYALVAGHGFPYRNPEAALVTPRGKLWLAKEAAGIDRENRFRVVRATDLLDRPAPQVQVQLEPALERLRREMTRFVEVRDGR